MDESARAAALAELQGLVLTTAEVEEFVDGLARAAARHVGPGTAASITLRREGRPVLVAASDPRAAACAEVEDEAGEGPCIAAIAMRALVHVPDITQDSRWPAWRVASLAHDFRSAAALPRDVRPGVHVALNLYATDPWAWDDSALAVGDLYADEVARAVELCLRSTDRVEVSSALQAALVSRATIDRAIGVVMAENRCSAHEAMAILRSASRHREVTLREVAAVVVEAVTGSPPHEVPRSSRTTDQRAARVAGRAHPA